jgi:hypothetical protein
MNRTFASLFWADRYSLHRVGMCARQRSHFLLLAQEKVTKEKGTPIPAAPAGLLCAARARREVQKLALRAQTSELLDPSCPALLDASHGDPKSQQQRRARLAAPNIAARSFLPIVAMRSEPYCIGFSGPLRRAEQRSGRRKKKRSCLSPYSGEFCASRLPRAAQGSPEGAEEPGSPFFWFLFFGEAKKRDCAVGRISRRGATRKEDHQQRPLIKESPPC